MEKIKELVEKYKVNRDYYLTNAYNETLLRSDFLDPLFELIGWDIKNNAGKATNEREVILEEALKASASENAKKPDYTFRLFSERKYFLEAKKPFVSIEINDEAAKQVRRYGFTAKLKISVLSNFEYLIIYDTSTKVEKTDGYQKSLVKKYHYTEYSDKFEEIKKLLGKDSVYSGQFDIEWKDIETQISHYSIDKLFLKQINEWRLLLGTEIFNHFPLIDEQQLNDIVQSYLNRVLFLRVCEDRNLEDYQTLLQFANSSDFKALINKFKTADKKYNSGLFDQVLSEDIIENISSAFWVIIKQLYYPESTYSFSVFSSDILGSIYEVFLSQHLSIQDNNVCLVKKLENLNRDVITTPVFIIQEILKHTVVAKCKGKTYKEILKLKFGDISCGSGAFLLELFQLLHDMVIDYYLSADVTALIQTNVNTYKLPFKIKKELLLSCIFGVDKDFNAVEATKFGLLLKLLEGEDVSSTNNIKPVLPDLDNNILFGNSLLNTLQVPREFQVAINPYNFDKLKFDVLIGNPPYMKSEDMNNLTPVELPLYIKNYSSAYKQFDKYFLFIEQGLNLLTPDGLLGYIVPNKFIKVGAGKNLRQELITNEHINTIVSFGANQVFEEKTTYTCLLILSKSAQKTFQFSEVRNLRKWRLREASELKFDTKTTADFDSGVWALVPPHLISAYNKILAQSISLEDLVGKDNIFNGIQTSANDIYVFNFYNEDNDYFYFEKDKVKYQIEKGITKSYFKTSSGGDNLYTYRTFKPNARVIYPYINKKSGVELIPLATIKKKYPFAYAYLLKHEKELNSSSRDIKPTPKNKNEWHRFGRQQGLNVLSKPEKIILGVLSSGNKYAIDKFGTLFTSGGTAGYCAITTPDTCEYSVYYIQAILNSKYVEWFVSLTGEIFRGGYFARGTKVLSKLPIRKIDFNNKDEVLLHEEIVELQKLLIKTQDEIDLNQGNKRKLKILVGLFNRDKATLDSILKKLYNIGNEDSLIPTIKELYEAN